jgi:hypothetical protein
MLYWTFLENKKNNDLGDTQFRPSFSDQIPATTVFMGFYLNSVWNFFI